MSQGLDHVKKVLRCRLGLASASDDDTAAFQRDLRHLTAWLQASPKNAREAADALLQPIREAVEYVLSHPPTQRSNKVLWARWQKLLEGLRQQGELPQMMVHRAASLLLDAQALTRDAPAVRPAPPSAPPVSSAPASAAARPTPGPPAPAASPPAPPSSLSLPALDAAPRPSDGPEPTRAPSPPTSPSASPDSVPSAPERPQSVAANSSPPASAADASESPQDEPTKGANMDSPAPAGDPGLPGGEQAAAGPAPTAASLWKYLPVPEDPDRHDESECRSEAAPDGLRLLGARVRGKKHKHEGTHCDDWFSFRTSGPWTVIAVADGAGSCRFSRVGARASCEEATQFLGPALADHHLGERDSWIDALRRDETTCAFPHADLQAVQELLHQAMRRAFEAIQRAAADRAQREDCVRTLGRPLALNDLSATLLLAVHTVVPHRGADHSFVLACQVGDGMTAAIDLQGQLHLLGAADSGSFSGETDFLTSRNKLDPDNLARKTFGFFRPLRSLLVMTDGVADDYFPNDPELLRLYADLALNGILPVHAADDPAGAAALARSLPDQADGEIPGLDVCHPVPTPDGPRPVCVRSAAAFAARLGLSPLDLAARPALLAAAARPLPVGPDGGAAERLGLWLDSYHVRGSFDDRTLVVLHRESLP